MPTPAAEPTPGMIASRSRTNHIIPTSDPSAMARSLTLSVIAFMELAEDPRAELAGRGNEQAAPAHFT
jgi:hypothetical protein